MSLWSRLPLVFPFVDIRIESCTAFCHLYVDVSELSELYVSLMRGATEEVQLFHLSTDWRVVMGSSLQSGLDPVRTGYWPVRFQSGGEMESIRLEFWDGRLEF